VFGRPEIERAQNRSPSGAANAIMAAGGATGVVDAAEIDDAANESHERTMGCERLSDMLAVEASLDSTSNHTAQHRIANGSTEL